MKNLLSILFLVAFTFSLSAQEVNHKIDYPEQIDSIGSTEISGFPSTITPDFILQANPTGTAYIAVPATVDTDLFSEDKTATADRDHNLSTFNYRLGNANYDYFLGNNGSVDLAGFRQVNSATNWYQSGLADFSGFGLGHVGFLGEADLTGADATNIIVSPLLGNILINSSDGATFNMYSHTNQSSVNQLFDLKGVDPALGYNVGFESQIDAGVLKPKMYATSNDGSTNLTVLEMTQSQASLFTDDGNLEYTQTLTDFTFLDSDPVTGIGAVLNINESGDITASQYTNTRVDVGTAINFISTDANGTFQSKPLSEIAVNKSVDTFVEFTGGETSVNLNAAPASESDILVYLNGQLLTWKGSTPDWTLSGTTLTLTSYVGVVGSFIEVLAR